MGRWLKAGVASSVSLALVVTTLVLCPCPSDTAMPGGHDHDCCPPAEGLNASHVSCCGCESAPPDVFSGDNGPVLPTLAPIGVTIDPRPALPSALFLLSHPPPASGPPPILRI